jgi:universal stress protein A
MSANIERIVVATDFSRASDAALDYASDLARTLGASIHLVHVIEESFTGWELYVRDAQEVRERIYANAQTSLSLLASSQRKRQLIVTTELRHGAAADAVARAAADARADLIVVGTHGRSGVPHMLLGSVAERIIRNAPCPVLAVRQVRAGEGAPPKTERAA